MKNSNTYSNKFQKLKRQMREELGQSSLKFTHADFVMGTRLKNELSSPFSINSDGFGSDFSNSPADVPRRLDPKEIEGHASRFKKIALIPDNLLRPGSDSQSIKHKDSDNLSENLSQLQDSDRSFTSIIRHGDGDDALSVNSHEASTSQTGQRNSNGSITPLGATCLRRHSEAKPTAELHNALQERNKIYNKRKHIFQIESEALKKVLGTFGDIDSGLRKQGSTDKEIHSAHIHSSSSSSDDYFSDDNQDCISHCSGSPHNDGESPLILNPKSVTPNPPKSIFYNPSKLNNDSEEEKKEPAILQSGILMRKISNGPNSNTNSNSKDKDNAEKEAALERMQIFHETVSGAKKQIWPPQTKKMHSLLAPTGENPTKVNKAKLKEKIVKLRKDLNKKQATMDLYTMIRDKGKMMINKPPYSKSNLC